MSTPPRDPHNDGNGCAVGIGIVLVLVIFFSFCVDTTQRLERIEQKCTPEVERP